MNFDKMMQELRRDYVASLPQKIMDIQKHLDAGDAALLRDDFHKLKGTGKTYGIPEISDLGEAVEKICLHLPAEVSVVVPVAVKLLSQIHTARAQANQPFNVKADPAFAPILKLATPYLQR